MNIILLDLIGWAGAILFAICGFPQAIKCWKQGHGKGISKSFMWMWYIGEICLCIYTPLAVGWSYQLMINYVINIIFVSVILRYIYFPRKGDKSC